MLVTAKNNKFLVFHLILNSHQHNSKTSILRHYLTNIKNY
jgi:hypothetical protein